MCVKLIKLKLAEPTTRSETKNPYYDKDPKKIVKKLFGGLDRFFKTMGDILTDDYVRGSSGFVLGAGSGDVLLDLFERIIKFANDHHVKPIRTEEGNLTLKDWKLIDDKGNDFFQLL